MKNKSLVIAKINFRNIKSAYIITAIVFGLILVQDIVFIILNVFGVDAGAGDGMTGIGNFLYLLVILSAIFIPSHNFRRIMNLGGKRDNYFSGCAVTYAIMAAAVSLAGIILYYTYENLLLAYYDGWTLNVLYWFGWIAGGPVIAFIRQVAFLFLLAVFTHTLTAVQDKWYGWAADILIVAIISVFPPIAPLRSSLVWFFYMIIFHPNAFLQITTCLILAALIYWINRPIFARKVI